MGFSGSIVQLFVCSRLVLYHCIILYHRLLFDFFFGGCSKWAEAVDYRRYLLDVRDNGDVEACCTNGFP